MSRNRSNWAWRRKLKRSAPVLAVLVGAASAVIQPRQVQAVQRTWNNTTGNWSLSGNWSPAGAPAAGDVLEFGGVVPYTSTNDQATVALDGLVFSNSDPITLAGANAIGLAGGANGVNRTDFSSIDNVTISAPITDSTAAADTGAAFRMNTNRTVTLAGGGNLYGLRSSSGTIVISGGTLTLTSTQRGNDPVGGIVDAGSWGMSARGSSTIKVDNGAVVMGQEGFCGDDNGAGIGDGTLIFTGGSTTTFNGATGRFGVNYGFGALTVSGGAVVNGRLFEGGRQGNNDVRILITGANSVVNANQLVLVRSTGTGSMTISNGGKLNLTVNGPAAGSTFIGGSTAGNVATFSVDGAGSIVQLEGTHTQYNSNAYVTSGGQIVANRAVISPEATMTGSLTIDGAGSKMDVSAGTSGFVITGGAGVGSGGTGIITVRNQGLLKAKNINLAQNDGTSLLTVTGAGSSIVTILDGVGGGGQLGIGGVAAGQGTVNINDTATASLAGIVFVGNGGPGALFVNNATMTVGRNLQTATEPGSTGTMLLNHGARLAVAGSSITATDAGSNAWITLDNATLTVATTTNLSVAANATGPGSTRFLVLNGSLFSTGNGTSALFTSGLPGSSTALAVAGDGSRLVCTGETIASSALGASSAGSTAISFSEGGVGTFAGNLFTSPSPQGGVSVIDIDSPGSVMASTGTFQMQFGGAGGTNGGSTTVTLRGEGELRNSSLVAVYGTSTLNVGSDVCGCTGTGFLNANGALVDVRGRVNYNHGKFIAGRLDISPTGSVIAAQKNIEGNTGVPHLLLATGTVTVANGGYLDLADNSMIVASQPRAQVEALVSQGRDGGLWSNKGITSKAARTRSLQNTTLGVLSGQEYLDIYGAGATFEGMSVNPTDSLVKYTYYGDTDFNGLVDFDDYVRIDAGFNGGLTGWVNGDFDLSGAVDFDDFVLIDLVFNSQDEVMARGQAVGGLSGDLAIIPAARTTPASMRTSSVGAAQDRLLGEVAFRAVDSGLAAVPEPRAAVLLAALGTSLTRSRRMRQAKV